MAEKKKGGLGRGLGTLFADNSIEEENGSPLMLKIYEIEPNRDQPRKDFDEDALNELADSIAEHGIIQPLLVRPIADGSYQIIAGERRWRAARMAGLTEVPVLVKEISESEIMELALVENLQREDLNPIEEAEGLQVLMETYGMTQEEAAKRVGKSRPAVANATRLLALPAKVIDMLKDGSISAGHARALLALSDDDKIKELAAEIVKKGMSVRDTERLVKFMIKNSAKPNKKQKKRDIFYDEVELSVSDAIGRKAKVNVNSSGKGTIEIEFYNKEDLAKLTKMFNKE
ncbi:MAG: ParB/RepB/Spo0J family partition protein [Faecalibacterium sp.]|nr:ParB/RepB/Spo0J family partition protein [Ruminococcus sp.]MCM1391319.1 ParB/RepB/Spo0J family partition protein [Ruminococcus sp.]MCM1484873.1 ParB/RepB/Spo0J family partition protein [Faecalibacterium sp.]